MATAIGVISGIISIFSFIQDSFPQTDTPNAKFSLKIGLNGAQPPGGGTPLSAAGGEKPDVRLWDENGGFLGIEINDGNRCVDGSDVCNTQVDNIRRQPTYTLFTANDDALCVSYIQNTYPSGLKYANVIGNWAEECSERHGVSQATWYVSSSHDGARLTHAFDRYWSDIYAPVQDGYREKVKCAWIDRNGDQPTTGIQIHWPDFEKRDSPERATDFYCNNHPTLWFHTDYDPSDVRYYTAKRDIFARDPSISTSTSVTAGKPKRDLHSRQSSLSNLFSNTLVKSLSPDHKASELCNAKSSAGPSAVSYEERQFCFMPTKTLFPFCDDIALGLCWSEELNLVVPKAVDTLIAPTMSFTETLLWGQD